MATQTPRLERVRTVDGVAIAYTTVGTGPLAIIALHGWGGAGSGHSWRELVKHIDLTGLRFIAMDLRGHGASDRPEIGFDLDEFGRDVLAVADHAGAAEARSDRLQHERALEPVDRLPLSRARPGANPDRAWSSVCAPLER